MGPTVYADVFFLINFSMDFLCFYLTAKILGRPLRVGRGLLGATVGGVYANLALLIHMEGPLALLTDLSVCALMCAIFFYRRGEGRELPLHLLVYGAVSMALGGFMTALFSLLNRTPLGEASAAQEGDGISAWGFFLLAAVSGGLTYLGGRFFRHRSSVRWAELEISYGGKTARLKAMADTGNLLRDPISGRMCVIADIRAVEEILPLRVQQAARSVTGETVSRLRSCDGKNLRMIPTHTASGEGLLLAIRPERLLVNGGKGFHRVDALVALTELGDHARGSQALLPPQLL